MGHPSFLLSPYAASDESTAQGGKVVAEAELETGLQLTPERTEGLDGKATRRRGHSCLIPFL